MAQLLITGGAGFIGSHTCLTLLEGGHSLVVIDNFSNSSPEALRRVMELACLEDEKRLKVVEGDIRHSDDLNRAFTSGEEFIQAVIHFAGLKAVGESLKFPLRYWDVNVSGTRCLLEAMERHYCRTIVFSSSATLYGYPSQVPIVETSKVQPINPYGQSKAAVEQLLADLFGSSSDWRIAALRYFNPVGAHPSGQIGEAPTGMPNNLFPILMQVAVGQRKQLQVFGGNWPTPDGSPIRDYIHVMDLAEAHMAALEVLRNEGPQLLTLNIGSGTGYSVLEVLQAFEEANGIQLPYSISTRREGDAACSVADPSLAAERLRWHSKRDLIDMCRDGWAWQQANPSGYLSK